MLLCICKGPRKGANYCTEETMCSLQPSSQPGKQTKIPTTRILCWYTLVRFPGCTRLGILVGFPGCTLRWYLATLCWYHNPTSSWLFNHRLVTLVTDKLERQWLRERFALVLKTNCIRKPSEHLWEDITNALQSYSKELLCCYSASRWFPHRCSEGCQCSVVVRWTGQLPFGLPYAISLQYQSTPLCNHCLSSLSATRVTNLWLNNQLVFAVM